MDAFLFIKQQYNELRKQQRKIVIGCLKNNGFQIYKEKGCRGRSNYTSSGRLKTSYDLSNWKWIEAELEGKHFMISLQSFDKDMQSGNHHVLMDRIGIYKYEKYSPEDAYIKMVTTDIDLPMDDDKLEQLVNILKRMAC